jgi:hypothetical protein
MRAACFDGAGRRIFLRQENVAKPSSFVEENIVER